MKNISLNIDKVAGFVSKETIAAYAPQVKACIETLENGTGKGNDFLGWLHLPSSITAEHLTDLQETAQVLRENCEVVIVAGIGGSYLGARAIIEALSNSFQWLQEKKNAPTIIYAGHNIGEDYLFELTEFLKDKKFGVINISKSGTTTETALAFRLLKKQCEDQRGKEMAKKVIVAITDAKKGAARVTADKEGYKSFIIPDNVGGRFSVLTPVGLLPIAVAGYEKDVAHLHIMWVEEANRELPSKIYLFQGLPKGDKMELIIQKAVELGVYEIIPVATKRAVVKLDAKKAEAKQKRWQSIAESAAKQSRRNIIPHIHEVVKFGQAVDYAKNLDITLIPYELAEDMEKTKQIFETIQPGQSIGIFIGPEGGFDESEIALAQENGISPITLGKRILRTETAGMAVLSVLMFQLEGRE